MTTFTTQALTWRRLSIGSALVIAATLSATAAAGPKPNADQRTCAEMGAAYGTPAHTACMLQQQQRRDQKMSTFLDQQLMHQELGRPAREKLEAKRAARAREKCRDPWRD